MIATVPVTTNGGKTHLVIGLHLDAIELLLSGKVLRMALDPRLMPDVLSRIQGLEFFATAQPLAERIMEIAEQPELVEWVTLEAKPQVEESLD